MLIFKKKNLIKFGLNFSSVTLSKFKFLNKLILSNNLFYSIIDIKLLIYKLLNFLAFMEIYTKNLKYKRTVLFVDGTLNKKLHLLNSSYLLKYNYFYINRYNWLPIFYKDLQLQKINFVIFWDYTSFLFKINMFYVNLPFFFFFKKSSDIIKNLNIKFFKNANFLFSDYNTEISHFFWLCTINHLILSL